MTGRGEGRNRSEIADLDRRLEALDEELRELTRELAARAKLGMDRRDLPQISLASPAVRGALFTLEAYAWAFVQRLRAELFERRLDLPKSDAEIFSILQFHDIVDAAQARKLRQFCEVRFLSSRDLEKIDLPGVLESISPGREEAAALLIRLHRIG
jgi:hypothetical protein